MQLKALYKRKKNDKKHKINDKDILNNKLKKYKINKESIEFNKVYILSPTINIENRECYIFEPLNKNISHSTKRRNIREINSNADKLINNFDNDEIILKRPKIKVKLNSMKKSNKISISQEKSNNIIKYKIKKITPINRKEKKIILNYSCLDNRLNQNNNNSKIYNNSIQNSFESPTENAFQKNKNQSYSHYYYNRSYEKSVPPSSNYIDDLKYFNFNKTIYNYGNINKDGLLNKSEYCMKNKSRQSVNRMAFNNINKLKLNDANKIYVRYTEDLDNNNCLTKNKNSINSHSFKSFNKDSMEISKLKLVKTDVRNNDLNCLFSPNYTHVQNTYQKKLVKRHVMKIDNNKLNNNTFKIDNVKNKELSNDKIKMKNIFRHHNYIFNSPKNNYSSNNLSIFGLFNTKSSNENMKENSIILNSQLDSRSNNKTLYNNFNYNKEKDDTKFQTDQNNISDNNYSTINSFYYYKKNNNNASSQKLLSSNKIEHKLKNLVTSIDYKNADNDDKSIKKDKNKNIILYEVDRKGQVNYKVREMKNSVEKVVRKNSELKKRSKIIEFSPKSNGMFSLYVKKNQGTVLRKLKNKKNRIEYYSKNTIQN